MNTSDRHSLEGTLWGTAVGDALGLSAEGLSPQRIRNLWRGTWRMRLVFGRGMFSDDTEHTYAVAQSLADHPDDVDSFRRALASRLRWWFAALPGGIGLATAKACIRLWCGMSPAKSGVFSAGNGPAMRSAVIGVYFKDHPRKRREFVKASTHITHTDPKAEAAALAIAEAAACAANDGDRAEFITTLQSLSDEPEWRLALVTLHEHLARNSDTAEFASALGLERGVTGYAFHTVPVALYAWLRYPDDYAKALISALNCGGDTDTVGAITGGICGAACGKDGIPAEWRSHIRDWPLSPAELSAAASALQNGSKPPALFWPARLVRNMAFLIIILLHGFRRLLPPY